MLTAGTTLGRYRLDRLLGRGGMGAVYLAFDTALYRPVALKLVDGKAGGAASGDRALQEARNASALSHPNICTIFEVGEADGSPFIAMEYVDGESLRDRIDKVSRSVALPLEDALRYGLQAADALAHAHERGVIHRDIKAANAIVASNGWLKLVDFGLARRTDLSRSDETTFATVVPVGTTAGTPYSMAPEQVRGASIDSAADVWGLGVLLYEMVAGARPFTAATDAELFAAVLRDEPSPLPAAIPHDVQSLIRRCLTKEPSARCTAAEARDAIKAILAGTRPDARIAGADTSRGSSSAARKRLLVLPFTNISDDPDTDYFADGLTEELIADLSRIGSLQVISRTSAMRLKGRTEDIRTLAARVGVDLVLDGSVRKSRNSLRIGVQLVDAAIDSLIWAGKFTAGDEDLFDVQERLSREIIAAMQITLTQQEAERVVMRPIADVRVYDIYLRARQKFVRFSAQDLDEAVELIKSGLDVLKGNELLLGSLGHAYLMFVHWGVRPDPKYLDQAQQCADEILRTLPGSAVGHALRGGIEIKRGNVQNAVRHLKEAIRSDPSNLEAVTWLAYAYLTAGQPNAARPLVEFWVKLDPLTGLAHVFYGWPYMVENRFEEALPHYRRAYELDPGAPILSFLWGMALNRTSRTLAAAAHLRQLAATAPSSAIGELAAGFGHALAGDAEAGRRAIGPMTVAAARSDDGLARMLAYLYTRTGDFDDACAWLETSVARGYLDYPAMSRDRAFDPLRELPRFQNLLAEVKQRWEAFEV